MIIEVTELALCTQGYNICLDGRAIKTPDKSNLTIPSKPLAYMAALEWYCCECSLHLKTVLILTHGFLLNGTGIVNSNIWTEHACILRRSQTQLKTIQHNALQQKGFDFPLSHSL